MNIQGLLYDIWNLSDVHDERNVKEWAKELTKKDCLVFDTEDDVRAWALKNSDLVEPEP